MRIAIVEDEMYHRQKMQEYLRTYEKEYGCKAEVQCYSSGTELIREFGGQYDLILLDVAMAEMDGFETARYIRSRDTEVAIIFITNLAQYAIRGYEVDAIDYILKPVSYFAFSQRLNRAIRRIRKTETHYVMISDRNATWKLDTDRICYVESQGHNLIYHTLDGNYTVSGTMREAEDTLKNYSFYRSNKGYLVALKHVDGIRDGCALVNGEELLISRARRNGFLEALTDYIGGPSV